MDGFLEGQIVIHKGMVRPEQVAELFADDDFARALQQGSQHLERLGRKPLLHARLAQFASLQVHLKDSKPEQVGFAGRWVHRPAPLGAASYGDETESIT